MPKYLIERDIEGAHKMSAEERREAARASCGVLDDLGEGIDWQESFITEDRVTCVYVARDKAIIEEHAQRSGFPAHRVTEVVAGMNPALAGSSAAGAPAR